MARYKIKGPIDEEYGVEYVVNPSGVIWAVHESHPSPDWWPRTPAEAENPQTLVHDAEQRRGGWRLATEDEIKAYVKANPGEWLPPELEEKAAEEPEKRGPGRPPKAPSAEA